MNDNRYEVAQMHGMSKEFIDWFFDEKKEGCGSQWFIIMAAAWEGWKAATPRWVKCPDRMPPEGIDVLCAAELDWAGDWRRKVGYWHNSKWVVYGATWTPTHWMDLPPIPQPPTD